MSQAQRPLDLKVTSVSQGTLTQRLPPKGWHSEWSSISQHSAEHPITHSCNRESQGLGYK